MKQLLPASLLLWAFTIQAQDRVSDSSHHRVSSPDQQLELSFYQKEDPAHHKTMHYQVSYKNKVVIRESVMDIHLDNHLSENAMALKVDHHARWCENLQVTGASRQTVDSVWTPVNGERSTIRDHYNGLTISLVKDDNPDYQLEVQIRVYNEGVAFRYFFPEHPKGTYYRITGENSTFTLPVGTKAWVAAWAQGPYQLLPLQNWQQESERPLTLQLPGGLYACLAEAGMTDYARTKFRLSSPNTLATSMFGAVDLISPVATPWRAIMVAEQPGTLLENNSLLLNLNAPSRIHDPSWIQPGKIMREMTLTDEGARATIDFAAAHGLQYILFDWKWYGPAFSFNSDATKVVVPMDMPGIIRYGKEKNIGVWLYVNQQALLMQKDSLFQVFNTWGVKGVKFGFVQVGSHRWTTWLEDAIAKAAAAKIMVNIHDEWRPTGEQRTWPNLMTAEGVRGNEEMPDATNNTILPFTRMIAGPADYTICYYNPRIKTTHAHQLALAAIYYSPLQTLFWYDKPADYHQEPEIEFFEKIPTVWDETKCVNGIPGSHITMARRSGADWFVGAITNTAARTLALPLDFLEKGKQYKAHIYSDDPTVPTATKVRVSEKMVDAKVVLSVKLSPSGGQAIWLEAMR